MNYMKQRKRSSLEIRCDILSVVAEAPQRKTWILYKANLNLTSLHRHLMALMEHDLIAENITGNGNTKRYTYCITPKGVDIQHYCRLIQKAFDPGAERPSDTSS